MKPIYIAPARYRADSEAFWHDSELIGRHYRARLREHYRVLRRAGLSRQVSRSILFTGYLAGHESGSTRALREVR